MGKTRKSRAFKFKRRQLSIELIDRLLSLYEGTGGDNDEFMELFWGKANEADIIPDLLTLARVALAHLDGASFLVHETALAKPKKEKRKRDTRPSRTSNRVSGDGQSSGIEIAHEDDKGFPAVDAEGVPGSPDTST